MLDMGDILTVETQSGNHWLYGIEVGGKERNGRDVRVDGKSTDQLLGIVRNSTSRPDGGIHPDPESIAHCMRPRPAARRRSNHSMFSLCARQAVPVLAPTV